MAQNIDVYVYVCNLSSSPKLDGTVGKLKNAESVASVILVHVQGNFLFSKITKKRTISITR